jgi:hypothetical protein
MTVMPGKTESGETRLLKEVVENLSCIDPAGRKQALDALMVFAWRPGWKPAEFIAMGGLPPLVSRLEEEDEKMRHHAVEIIERIARLGASADLVGAGVLPVLHRMAATDRYEPVRMTAARAAAMIAGER